MKLKFILTLVALAALLPAQATLYTYSFSVGDVIPDAINDTPGELSDTRTISGIAVDSETGIGFITDVNVTLTISGGFNGDLYGYLVHDSGFAVLLNRVGRTSGDEFGYGNTGFSILLDDQAGTDIHLYQTVTYTLNGNGQLLGSWQPDGRETDPDAVLDTDDRTALLSSFNDLDPNGTWTLFLADLSAGGESTLVGWGLEVNVVPEPTEWALMIFGGLVGAVQVRRWWQGRRRAAEGTKS